MRLFVHLSEDTQLNDFTCVAPCDSKGKTKYSVTQKCIASIRQRVYLMLIVLCFMLYLFS